MCIHTHKTLVSVVFLSFNYAGFYSEYFNNSSPPPPPCFSRVNPTSPSCLSLRRHLGNNNKNSFLFVWPQSCQDCAILLNAIYLYPILFVLHGNCLAHFRNLPLAFTTCQIKNFAKVICLRILLWHTEIMLLQEKVISQNIPQERKP